MAVMALALTGCSGSGDTEANDSNGSSGGGVIAVFNGATGAFVENFNPLSPTVLANVQGMMYEPLFFFNNLASLDTPAVPLLGEEYQWNEDGTQLDVTLKEDVVWSDGEAFTAEDVAFTFNLIRDTPELNTSGNAPAAEVVDETHVTLVFDLPSFTDGPSMLGSTYIVPEHIWAEKTEVATDPNSDPVATGPMELAEFTAQSYLLEKSDSFRGADELEVDGVRVLSLSGNQAGTDAILAGEVDWASIFIPDVDQVLQAAPDVSYSAVGSQQINLATCSSAELGCAGPQTSVAVRQAIYAAIDREQINQLAYFGKGSEISPTFALIERDEQFIADFAEPAPMSPNVEEAQSILEADGWTMGSDGIYEKDGERLSMDVIVTSGYTDYIATLTTMTQQLQDAGIEIQTQQVANAENLSAQGLGNFELAIHNIYQGPVGDPYYIYNNFFNGATTGPVGESVNPYGNISRFSNPDVDAAIAAAAATEDLDAKAAAYEDIQAVIVEQMPYIPVLNNVQFGEFSTANYEGWPTYEDQYASAAPYSGPGNGQVLVNLRAK